MVTPGVALLCKVGAPLRERCARVFVHDREPPRYELEAWPLTASDAVTSEMLRFGFPAREHLVLHAVRPQRIERDDSANRRLSIVVQRATLLLVQRWTAVREPQVERTSCQQHIVRALVSMGQAVPKARGELIELAAQRGLREWRPSDTLDRQATEERVLMME